MFTPTTLDRIAPDRRAAAFNAVYADYVVPVALSDAQIAEHIDAHDVRAAISPVWLDPAGEVAALALVGVRGARGWIGGFGIASAHRGRGLARALLDDTLAAARALGLAEIVLEVLVENERAIRTYAAAGFVRTRDLRVLVRAGDAPAPPVVPLPAHPATLERAHAIAAAFDRTSPCWQRERASLARTAALEAITFGDPAAPAAAAAARAVGDGARVALLAARDGTAGAGALAALVARWPGLRIAVVNEPDGAPLAAAYEACGFREVHRQHEMRLALAPAAADEPGDGEAGAAARLRAPGDRAGR